MNHLKLVMMANQQLKTRKKRIEPEIERLIFQLFKDDITRREIKKIISEYYHCPSCNTLSKRIVELRTGLVKHSARFNDNTKTLKHALGGFPFVENNTRTIEYSANNTTENTIYALKVRNHEKIIFESSKLSYLTNDITLYLQNEINTFFESNLNIHLLLIPSQNITCINKKVQNNDRLQEFIKFYNLRKGKFRGCKDGKNLFLEETIYRFNGSHETFLSR